MCLSVSQSVCQSELNFFYLNNFETDNQTHKRKNSSKYPQEVKQTKPTNQNRSQYEKALLTHQPIPHYQFPSFNKRSSWKIAFRSAFLRKINQSDMFSMRFSLCVRDSRMCLQVGLCNYGREFRTINQVNHLMCNFDFKFISCLTQISQTEENVRTKSMTLMFDGPSSSSLGPKKAQRSIIKYHLHLAHLQTLSFHSSSPFMFNNLILSDIKYFIFFAF